MTPLRDDLIRLANERSELRSLIVPILRTAAGKDATFWFELSSARNKSVKDYELENRGDSRSSGDFQLTGTLHVKPKGAAWSAEFPVNQMISVAQDPGGGHAFSAQRRDPASRLLQMALHDYKVENAIMTAIGKLDFVPYGKPMDPETQAYEWLTQALRKQKLPTSSGRDRRAISNEFALMSPKPVQGYWQFKHSDTRNYVLIDARNGKMTVPKTTKPFFRGEFDKFGSVRSR